jgi:hypothetical protein
MKTELEKLRRELRTLRKWKSEAMEIMAPIQDIGKEIGVPMGQSIHDKILPWIIAAKKAGYSPIQ